MYLVRNVSLLLLGVVSLLCCSACVEESSDSNTDKTPKTISKKVPSQEPTKQDKKGNLIKVYPVNFLNEVAEYPKAGIFGHSYQEYRMKMGIHHFPLGAPTPNADDCLSQITKKGNHLRLNMNNKKIVLKTDLNFSYVLDDGKHQLFALLAKSYHESFKGDYKAIAKDIEVHNGQIVRSTNIQNPLIIYSAPVGLFKNEDTKKILLDFYLMNTSIEEGGNQVRLKVNQEEFLLHKWEPYYIEGLGMGEHFIQLELLDDMGRLVYGPIQQKIILTEEPEDS
ncbi:MAG: hypothetical protein MK212_15615 [Saprospiraceae bacterium]|nr:hypothetical protein [Saprospiraceae bacterium]